MGGPDLLETFVRHPVSQFGVVAFPAQVPQVKMTQLGGHDLLGGIGGRFIREMAVATEDPLLETPGPVRTVLQHLYVVVRLQHQNVRAAHPLQDQARRVAQVFDVKYIVFVVESITGVERIPISLKPVTPLHPSTVLGTDAP